MAAGTASQAGGAKRARGGAVPVRAVDWRRERPHLLLVSGVLLAVYALTMPRVVTLEDSALFTLAARFGGVVHPPGYPLHTLLSLPFARLPFVSVAVGVSLLSAVAGALCCAVVFALARRWIEHRSLAYLAALGLGLSRAFWSQAIVQEVYTLAALLLFAQLLAAVEYVARPRRGPLAAFALLLGLGLANHWPFHLLTAPCPLLVLAGAGRTLLRDLRSPATLALCLALLALGLAPYLYLPLRSQADPPMSFYGPLEGFAELRHFVLREGYGEADVSPTAGAWDRARFALWTAREVARQHAWIGIVPALLGAVLQLRRLGPLAALALTQAFLATTWILHLGIGFDYDFLHRAVASVYPLVPYGVLSLWIALGTDGLARLAGPARAGAARLALAGLLVGATFLGSLPANRRAGDTWARDYAVAVLEALEPGAILFTEADFDTHPIAHVHLVEGLRPDVTVYNLQGLVLGNRLYDPRRSQAAKRDELDAFLRRAERPVYFTHGLEPTLPVERRGLVTRVLTDEPEGADRSVPDTATLRLLPRVLATRAESDPFTVFHGRKLLSLLGRWLADLLPSVAGSAPPDAVARAVDEVGATFHGRSGMVEALVERWPRASALEREALAVELARQVAAAEELLDPALPAEDRAAHHHRAAHVSNLIGDRSPATAERVRALLERSVATHPSRANPAVRSLLRFYAQTGLEAERAELARRFPDLAP